MAAPEQVCGIGVEGVQVDHRKGWIELVSGDIEPALERGLEKVHPDREAIRCEISYSPGRNTGHNAEPRLAGATSGRGNQGLEQGSLLRGRIAAVCGVARRFPREPDS
jgi:hypothetical protein